MKKRPFLVSSGWLLIAAFLLSSCSTPSPSVANPSDGGTNDSGRPNSDATEESAPFFLRLGTNVTRLTQGETVIFSAVLSDPDGIDDLIGGTLLNANRSVTYGAFVTGAQEGSYSLALSWAALNQSEEIAFDKELNRTFVAEFFDTAGHSAFRTIDLQFHCKGFAACLGACVDLSVGASNGDGSVRHCGKCGAGCGKYGKCQSGKCSDWTPCEKSRDIDENIKTCRDRCAVESKSCRNTCFTRSVVQEGQTIFANSAMCETLSGAHVVGCTEIIPYNEQFVRCCCE